MCNIRHGISAHKRDRDFKFNEAVFEATCSILQAGVGNKSQEEKEGEKEEGKINQLGGWGWECRSREKIPITYGDEAPRPETEG